ncbi:MAG: flagellar motor protein MotB [Clostridiales bacterium]|nr:flagellar motor protein MotB [Clostridiales bacterium]
MARKKKEQDSGGGANWMDTYGDLVTLLLCFFVMLFSFSNIDPAKWEALVGSLSGSPIVSIPIITTEIAAENPIPLEYQTVDPETEDLSEEAQVEYQLFLELYENVETYIDQNALQEFAEVIPLYSSLTLIIRFKDSILFNSGSSVLLPEAVETLGHVVSLLGKNQGLISMIRIEGHTDNRPIHNAQHRDNWELSVHRATSALRFVLESGDIDDGKISAVGYGEFHPVATNSTAEGQAQNRRVDFVVESYRKIS